MNCIVLICNVFFQYLSITILRILYILLYLQKMIQKKLRCYLLSILPFLLRGKENIYIYYENLQQNNAAFGRKVKENKYKTSDKFQKIFND